MSALTEFLLVCIADDEATARGWVEESSREWRGASISLEPLLGTPWRVLAECEAKRRIVELHDRNHECSGYDDTGEIDNCQWIDERDCSTVRLLALAYVNRPDYRDEWDVGSDA